jgi:hypothetical protein
MLRIRNIVVGGVLGGLLPEIAPGMAITLAAFVVGAETHGSAGAIGLGAGSLPFSAALTRDVVVPMLENTKVFETMGFGSGMYGARVCGAISGAVMGAILPTKGFFGEEEPAEGDPRANLAAMREQIDALERQLEKIE